MNNVVLCWSGGRCEKVAGSPNLPILLRVNWHLNLHKHSRQPDGAQAGETIGKGKIPHIGWRADVRRLSDKLAWSISSAIAPPISTWLSIVIMPKKIRV